MDFLLHLLRDLLRISYLSIFQFGAVVSEYKNIFVRFAKAQQLGCGSNPNSSNVEKDVMEEDAGFYEVLMVELIDLTAKRSGREIDNLSFNRVVSVLHHYESFTQVPWRHTDKLSTTLCIKSLKYLFKDLYRIRPQFGKGSNRNKIIEKELLDLRFHRRVGKGPGLYRRILHLFQLSYVLEPFGSVVFVGNT